MIIEPCCAPKQLPAAIMESPNRILHFYTYGDVTFEKFYHSLGRLIADPAVMVVTIPVIDIHVMRYLLQCFDREWITDLVLTTSADYEKFVQNELKDYLPHVSYVKSDYISSSTASMTLFTDKQYLVLTGNMPNQPQKGNLSLYTLLFQPDRSRLAGDTRLKNAIDLIIPLHRQQQRKTEKPLSPKLNNLIL